MNNGGDAAEQVVRLYLEGFEVVARLSGAAAKNVGAMLFTAAKQENKTKGKARLTSMLKSGKPLRVFSIPYKDLPTFTKHAKQYGILYNVLRDRTNKSPDSEIDILVRAEDAAKIQRIVDRFDLTTVDKASIVSEAEKSIAERDAVGRERPTKSRGQNLFDETMGMTRNKEKNAPEKPSAAKTEKSPRLWRKSKRRDSRTDEGRAVFSEEKKPSVRAELQHYKSESKRLQEESRRNPERTQREEPIVPNGMTVHNQPTKKKHDKER